MNMLLRAQAITLVLGFFYVPATSAGLLGPSNYEECVLEKMKGQAPGLIGMARAACLKAFPDEVVVDHNRIKYTWCKAEYNSVAVCINQLPDNVTITKIEGLFFEDLCEAKQQSKAGVKAIAQRPWYGTTYTFELPPAKRGCAYFTFYGTERK
jgi:hypothetical protein